MPTPILMKSPTLVLQLKFKTVFIILEEFPLNIDLMLLPLQHGLKLLSVVILFGVLVMLVFTNTILLILPILSMNLLWQVRSMITKRFGQLLKGLLFWVGLLLELPISTIIHWDFSTFQQLAQLLSSALLQDNIILQLLPIHQVFLFLPILKQLLFMIRPQPMLPNSLPKALQFHTLQRLLQNSPFPHGSQPLKVLSPYLTNIFSLETLSKTQPLQQSNRSDTISSQVLNWPYTRPQQQSPQLM